MSEPARREPQADPVFELMRRIVCHNCVDTGISITLYGVERCADCYDKELSEPATQLRRCVFTRLEKKLPVDTAALALARALTHFTAAEPLLLRHITRYCKVDERMAKRTIALLRDEWVLPVGSHRQPPYGSYWITSPEEFLAWSRAYRAQAITSLVTVHKLQRQHFPRLYGQQDFAAMIADELRETLR